MRTAAVFLLVLAAASLCAAKKRSIDPPRTEYPRSAERYEYLKPVDSSDPDHPVYLMIDTPTYQDARGEKRYLEPVDSSDPDRPVYLMIDPPKPVQKRSVDVNPPPFYQSRSVQLAKRSVDFNPPPFYQHPSVPAKRSLDFTPPPFYQHRSVQLAKRSAAQIDYSYPYDNPRVQVDDW